MRLAPVQQGCGRARSIEEIQFDGCWCLSLPVKWRNGQNGKLSCLFWKRLQKTGSETCYTAHVPETLLSQCHKAFQCRATMMWLSNVMRVNTDRDYRDICMSVQMCMFACMYGTQKSLSKSFGLWTAPESLAAPAGCALCPGSEGTSKGEPLGRIAKGRAAQGKLKPALPGQN